MRSNLRNNQESASGDVDASKVRASIVALRGQKGITDIVLRDDHTYLITTACLFQDNEPVRVQLKTPEGCEEELVASDCGDTIARLRTLIEEPKLDDRVQNYLKFWSALTITRKEDELIVSKVAADSLLYAVTTLALACSSLVKLEKTLTDFARSRQEEERRKRDEREARSFRLSSREEIVAFETRLHEFSLQERIGRIGQISLVDVHDVLAGREDRQQVVTALLDLVVNYCMLRLDVRDALRIWKGYFGDGGLASGSILDSELAFSLRMNIHRFNSSFVLRYRALWDKLMGVYVLIFEPSFYDGFQRAKSKKRAFLKVASRPGSHLIAFAQGLLDLLTDFDDHYRTPEAHHTGTIRKWTLIIEPYDESPQHKLNEFWGYLDVALEHLGDIFRGVERVQLANVRKTEVWLEAEGLPGEHRASFEKVLSVLRCAIPKLARNHSNELVTLVVYGTSYVQSARYWLYNRNRESFGTMMASAYKHVVSAAEALPAEVRETAESLVAALTELKAAIEET